MDGKGPSLRFDHVIILVRDLRQAVRRYQELGFHVVQGGKLKGGAQNAVIPFADGTYLELFSVGGFVLTLAKMLRTVGKLDAMAKGRGPMETRFIPHFARGEGIADYALHTDGLERQLELVRERKLDIAGPIDGSRLQADGTTLAFQWGLPHAHLPFLIADITPRNLRVPMEEAGKHTNGSMGIQELVMAVRDLQEATKHYSDLLGMEEEAVGSCRTKFSLGQTDLILVGAAESNEVRNHLDKYGASPFAIGLYTNDKARVGELDLSHTSRARISLKLYS